MQIMCEKTGIISVELALGILATITVLFVVLSNWSDNMNKIAMSTNMNNITQVNNIKTSYALYDRNYTNSDIYVK